MVWSGHINEVSLCSICRMSFRSFYLLFQLKTQRMLCSMLVYVTRNRCEITNESHNVSSTEPEKYSVNANIYGISLEMSKWCMIHVRYGIHIISKFVS